MNTGRSLILALFRGLLLLFMEGTGKDVGAQSDAPEMLVQ